MCLPVIPSASLGFSARRNCLASLNHPNIARVYGLEEVGGSRALVMEHVEGPTLADHNAEGPIPVAEALSIAKQIAETLEAAHEQGIIHRDLKPANIKLSRSGMVKVLDFGLAEIIEPAGGSSPSVSRSPTPVLPSDYAPVDTGNPCLCPGLVPVTW